MNSIYLISQIIGFIAFIISLMAYHKNKKEKIFKTMLLANILDIFHYFLLEAYSGCFTKILALIRGLVILIKEKHKKFSNIIILTLLLIIYLISGILTYENIFSILPILSAMIYLCFVWYGNELQVKKSAFYCYFLWLLYNICIFSIAGIVSNCVSILSTFIAVYNEKNKHKKS